MKKFLILVLPTVILLTACSESGEAENTATGEPSVTEAAETSMAEQGEAAPLPPAVGDGTVQRISFSRGANSAVIEGTVKGYGHTDYILNVQSGQYLNISMATDNNSNYFNILEPGETDAAIFVGSTSGNQFEGTSTKSGNYRIRVYLMRNAARRDETAKFRLETIVGEGTASRAATAAPADFIRGPGGLEEKCKARVNEMTGGKVSGTNRISESEAATEIYVNVAGAEAPWRCLGYRDRSIGDVMYTGSEGAL